MREKSSPPVVPTKVLELVLTHSFDAARVLVFEAWTTAEHMARWFGPRDFTMPSCEVEFRTGGALRFVMRGPDGTNYPFEGIYREIVAPERIVFTGTIHDGNEVCTTVTFAEQDGRTTLVVRQVVSIESDATRAAREGWEQTMDRLSKHLQTA
jgi:uncharacterized protein YndB with AHSA1/START domain